MSYETYESSAGFAIGLIIGVILTWIVLKVNYPVGDLANRVLSECESELPRNQECELTAIPREVAK